MKIFWVRIFFTLLLLSWTAGEITKLTKNEMNKMMKIKSDFKKLMDDHDNKTILQLFFGRISRSRVHTSRFLKLKITLFLT